MNEIDVIAEPIASPSTTSVDTSRTTKLPVVATPEYIKGRTVPELIGLIKDAPYVDITEGFPANSFAQLQFFLYAMLPIHSIPNIPIVGVKSNGKGQDVKIFMKISSVNSTIEDLIAELGNPEVVFSTSLEEGALPSTGPLTGGRAQLEVLPFPVSDRPHDPTDTDAIYVSLATHPYASKAPGLGANNGPRLLAGVFSKLGQTTVKFN